MKEQRQRSASGSRPQRETKNRQTTIPRGQTKRSINGWDRLMGIMKQSYQEGRTQTIAGIILLVLVMACLMSVVSHIMYADEDQSLLNAWQNGSFDPVEDSKRAANLLSIWGARVGAYLFNDLFGIGSFVLLGYVSLLSLQLIGWIRWRTICLLKYFVLSVFWTAWLSVFAFACEAIIGYDGALLWGGAQGREIGLMIQMQVGKIGLAGAILVSLVLILVLVWDKALFIVRDQRIAKPSMSIDSSGNWWRKLKFWQRSSSTQEERDISDELPHLGSQEGVIPDPEIYHTEQLTKLEEERGEVSFKAHAVVQTTGQTPTPSSGLIVEEALTDDLVEIEREEEPVAHGMLLAHYRKPDIDLLREYEQYNKVQSHEEIEYNKQRILDTLASFKIQVTPHKATIGPAVTLYEVIPDSGVKLSRIKNLEDDLALALKSEGIRIIAPMPGTGTVGIEVPNSRPQTVSMRSIMASRRFNEQLDAMELPIGMGKTITNEPFVFDLAKMPHMLIAGATGQGKSVGLNAMITSLLYSKRPEELKFVMVDPKMLEFSIYEAIEKHFLAMLPDADKAIITDMSRVVPTLNSLCIEMDDRYRLLTRAKVRNIKEYNELIRSGQLSCLDGFEPIPYIVLIVDEFADLIMTSGKEVEQPIARLAQKARAAGIHMIIATQRPSTDVITGLIKANFPARIAFKVFSMIDSRTILDSPGANQLVGRGDMLFYQGKDMIRIQCAFMDTPESEAIVNYIAQQEHFGQAYLLPEYVSDGEGVESKSFNANEKDALFDEVARMVVASGVGSTSNIQRKFNLGYNRAGRLMDQLEGAGIVGPQEGSKPREVIVKDLMALEQLLERLR